MQCFRPLEMEGGSFFGAPSGTLKKDRYTVAFMI